MIDVTAATLGLSVPPGELVSQLANAGWTVSKLEFSKKDNAYVAEAKNGYGEKLSKTGNTDSMALGNLLIAVQRHNHMRSASLRQAFGSWESTFVDKIQDIAEAYAQADHWDSTAAAAFKALADDCVNRAEVLGRQLHIEVVDDPHPYMNVDELVKDIHKSKHYAVSRANPEHPVWSVDQVIAYRTVHDIIGHAVAGAGYDWDGENRATAAHMPLLTPVAQQALFTEAIARNAYATFFQGIAPQKTVLFPEFVQQAQDDHNDIVHRGLHPSQTWAPEPAPGLPKIAAGELEHQAVLDANKGQNLQGLPGPVNVPGAGRIQFHSHGGIQDIAHSYMRENGIGQPHPTDYTKVDPTTSAQISQAYEQMEHNPNDPQVRASYEALARETRAQYDHAVRHGYNFEFYPQHDPYPNSPREAVLDLHHNKHMYVYPTEDGFGSHEEDEYQGNPLVGDSGVRWGGKPVTHNDLFRAIHDFYGHAKEGLGFRADGEDNAWRQHAAMFSPLARRAMTTETRGQNSWVNFGPHGEANQTATADSTVFAPQKTGLLPQWVEDPNLHRGQPAPRQAAVDDSLRDPNFGFKSGVEPNHSTTNGVPNAYLEHGDPLNIQHAQDNAMLIERRWWEFKTGDGQPDFARMEQAVANALRVAILSPKKELRHNAIQYQHLQGVAPHVDDPDVYWNTLEKARQDWNAQKYGEEARFLHRPWHYKDSFKKFVKLIAKHYPGESDPHAKAERIINQWVTEEQEREARAEKDLPESKQRALFEQDNAAYKAVADRLSVLLKEKSPDLDHFRQAATPDESQQIGVSEIANAGRYGAFMGTHLKAIAKIGQHITNVTQAAYTDITQHDGAGHHFRATVLQLKVPFVGPKVCSFAWLLLCPAGSQLATVDTHIMDMLGIPEGGMPNRDYFKAERQFRAGMDAAGYSHVPLGQAQWAAWDWKRTGNAQDHSPMAVVDSVPYDQVMWHPIVKDPNVPKGPDWVNKMSPDWWTNTQAARDQAGAQFDETLGSKFPKTAVPYQGIPGKTASIKVSVAFHEHDPEELYNAELAQKTHGDNSRPFIWNPDKQEIHMGNELMTHGDIPGYYEGEYAATGRTYGNTVEFFDHHKEVRPHLPAIREALAPHGFTDFKAGQWHEGPNSSEVDPWHFGKKVPASSRHTPSDGEFHCSLKIPDETRTEIKKIVDDLDFKMDKEVPEEYHMTWLFIKDDNGHREDLERKCVASNSEVQLKFTNARLHKFPARKDGDDDTVVIRFDSEEARDLHDTWEKLNEEEFGIDPGDFAGDYKPHISIGWTNDDIPSKKLPLEFTSEGIEVSPPAGEKKEATAVAPTKMQTLRAQFPGLTTAEIWAQHPESTEAVYG